MCEDSESPPRISALVAAMLATTPADTVPRAVLRAALPPGRSQQRSEAGQARAEARGHGGTAGNTVSLRLKTVLQEFERAGWVVREGRQVRILDRAALTLVTRRQPPTDRRDRPATPTGRPVRPVPAGQTGPDGRR